MGKNKTDSLSYHHILHFLIPYEEVSEENMFKIFRLRGKNHVMHDSYCDQAKHAFTCLTFLVNPPFVLNFTKMYHYLSTVGEQILIRLEYIVSLLT